MRPVATGIHQIMSLAERLAAGETVFTAWSGIPDALTVEAVANTAVDAVTLDMQHGGHHEDSVLRSLPAIIGSGKPAIVRIPVGRFDMASRALDFGADAVIAPMVNSVEDARLFAAAMKYPPVGQRSWGPGFAMPRRRTTDTASWLGGANAQTVAFAMIETREALAILDDILAVPGIDGVLLGPSDFSIAWSGGRTMNPALDDMMEAIADVGRRTVAAGKHAAMYVVDPKLTGRYAAMGYRLFALGNEQRYMSLGVANLLDAAKGSIG